MTLLDRFRSFREHTYRVPEADPAEPVEYDVETLPELEARELFVCSYCTAVRYHANRACPACGDRGEPHVIRFGD